MQNASRWLLAGVLGTSTTVSQAATLEERMAAFEARASAAEKRAAAAEQQTQALARELQQLKLDPRCAACRTHFCVHRCGQFTASPG